MEGRRRLLWNCGRPENGLFSYLPGLSAHIHAIHLVKLNPKVNKPIRFLAMYFLEIVLAQCQEAIIEIASKIEETKWPARLAELASTHKPLPCPPSPPNPAPPPLLHPQ